MTQLHEYFDDDGFLAQEVPLFIAREQQILMAQAVEKSLHDKHVYHARISLQLVP